MVETTLSMSAEMREAVGRAARLNGATRSGLVVAVLKRLMKEHGRLARDGGSVEYQKGRGDRKWGRLHIVIERRDHAFFVDMRNFCRRSVSLLVRIALDKYLDEVIVAMNNSDYDEMTDNYPFLHYIFLCNDVPGAVCWTICWGMPENHAFIADRIPESA